MGNTQTKIQSTLVVIAVLCVPVSDHIFVQSWPNLTCLPFQWMLLVKPLLLKRVAKRGKEEIPRNHGQQGHLHTHENDFINEEFDEGSPLLGRPNGVMHSTLKPPFCFNLCGVQGHPGSESHDGDHGEVCAR